MQIILSLFILLGLFTRMGIECWGVLSSSFFSSSSWLGTVANVKGNVGEREFFGRV